MEQFPNPFEEYRAQVAAQQKIIDESEAILAQMKENPTAGTIGVLGSVAERENEKIEEARKEITRLKEEWNQQFKKAA